MLRKKTKILRNLTRNPEGVAPMNTRRRNKKKRYYGY
jgi:hypothetical protein